MMLNYINMGVARILFSSLALTLGIITSVYFLIWWRRHRDHEHGLSLLLWALALFLMYWHQVPAILVSFGEVITITNFNLFFSLMFPITFLSLILVYLGVLKISGSLIKKKSLIFAWFMLAIIFFGYYFIREKGILNTHFPPIFGTAAFFVPIRLLIIFAFVKLIIAKKIKSAYGIIGTACVIGESALGSLWNFLLIEKFLIYPPQFWFMALSDSEAFFISQAIGIILLASGFYFLHKNYCESC